MCALVKGYTDILTPINLLPNSDFSRGQDTSLSLSDISERIGTLVAESVYMYNLRVKVNNLLVTRSKNSLRFQGQIQITSHTEGQSCVFGIEWNGILSNNTTYTGYCCAKDNVGNTIGASNYYIGSPSTQLYNHVEKTDNVYKSVSIRKTGTMSTNRFWWYVVYPEGDVGTTYDIDIEFFDMYLYEGTFCNPPVTTSLDVKPSNQFLRSNQLQNIIGFRKVIRFQTTKG